MFLDNYILKQKMDLESCRYFFFRQCRRPYLYDLDKKVLTVGRDIIFDELSIYSNCDDFGYETRKVIVGITTTLNKFNSKPEHILESSTSTNVQLQTENTTSLSNINHYNKA
jgi:hypothetical protein